MLSFIWAAVKIYVTPSIYRALNKKKYLMIIQDNFCLFCIKTHVVTLRLNCLNKVVQMRGHNVWI